MRAFSICAIPGTPAVVEPPAAALTGLLNVLGSPRIAATSRLGVGGLGASDADGAPTFEAGAHATEIAERARIATSVRISDLLPGAGDPTAPVPIPTPGASRGAGTPCGRCP